MTEIIILGEYYKQVDAVLVKHGKNLSPQELEDLKEKNIKKDLTK